jgi:plastocyanin
VPAAKTISLDVSASSASAYQFTGTDRRTVHTGAENDPLIVVNFGDTIEFNINSGASHPFYLRDAPSGNNSDNIATGITSGTNGATSGTITIDTSNLTVPGYPDLYEDFTGGWIYYQCGAHPGMKGLILVQATGNYQGAYYASYFGHTIIKDVDDLFYDVRTTDDGAFILPIGFDINVFGNTQSKIYVCCNQMITLNAPSSQYLKSAQSAENKDKILLGGGDRSASYVDVWWGGDPDTNTSYLFMDIQYPKNNTSSYSGEESHFQVIVKQADPDKIQLNVINNALREVKNDMYPFYASEILGGTATTGDLVVNNNQATLTITPTANFVDPTNETEVDVNLRLNYFGTPDVSFSVSESP